MGCSPGYLALMAEVLVEAGVKEGLTEDQALRMVARSMSATGGLLELHDPGALKRAVASPGGMTEAGLDALEEHEDPGDPARRGRRLARAACEAEHPLAGDPRVDVANYVDAIFIVYFILIFIRVLLSWIPRMPYYPLAARDRRLHPPGRRPVPEHLPARDAAARRRRHGDRHQPDPRDHRPVHRRARGRIADSTVEGPSERSMLWSPPWRPAGSSSRSTRAPRRSPLRCVERGDRSRCCRSSPSRTRATRGSPSASPATSRPCSSARRSSCWSASSIFLALRGPGSGWRSGCPPALLIGGALGQPGRPGPRRRGDRLRRPAALGDLQPRGRRDRRRGPAAAARCWSARRAREAREARGRARDRPSRRGRWP